MKELASSLSDFSMRSARSASETEALAWPTEIMPSETAAMPTTSGVLFLSVRTGLIRSITSSRLDPQYANPSLNKTTANFGALPAYQITEETLKTRNSKNVWKKSKIAFKLEKKLFFQRKLQFWQEIPFLEKLY